MIRHLIHIGYPKAGSTFLQHWFASHPQLAYQPGAIAGFHDVYSIARSAASPQREERYRVTSFEGLSVPMPDAGERVVDYRRTGAVDPATRETRACELLAALFPGAVVLVVTRGFRSMILSRYSQFLRTGGDVELPVLLASALGTADAPPEARIEVEHWDYDALIGKYRAAFGAHGVVVMPYELLRDDPAAFTAALEARLGLDPAPPPPGRVNASLTGEEMAWYPRLARAVRRVPLASLHRLYAGAAFTNRLRLPIRLLQRLRPATPVTAAMIPDAALEPFRGVADSLRSDPLYAPYAAEYLWKEGADAGPQGVTARAPRLPGG
ncbi:MAG TPA: sulfotransferase [Longimicrobium sp.]|jgi:hypothetical protein